MRDRRRCRRHRRVPHRAARRRRDSHRRGWVGLRPRCRRHRRRHRCRCPRSRFPAYRTSWTYNRYRHYKEEDLELSRRTLKVPARPSQSHSSCSPPSSRCSTYDSCLANESISSRLCLVFHKALALSRQVGPNCPCKLFTPAPWRGQRQIRSSGLECFCRGGSRPERRARLARSRDRTARSRRHGCCRSHSGCAGLGDSAVEARFRRSFRWRSILLGAARSRAEEKEAEPGYLREHGCRPRPAAPVPIRARSTSASS